MDCTDGGALLTKELEQDWFEVAGSTAAEEVFHFVAVLQDLNTKSQRTQVVSWSFAGAQTEVYSFLYRLSYYLGFLAP